MDLKKLAQFYKNELLNNVVPFWENHSKDEEFGGYFTCLDREGKVFDTDKFIWLQGREVWMFSTLFNKVEQKQQWPDMALYGAEFLQKYGHNENLNWFEKVYDYTWSHFADPEHGEWFGYLNRQGEVLLPLKGGKWKGCFHVPHGLYQVWKTLETLK